MQITTQRLPRNETFNLHRKILSLRGLFFSLRLDERGKGARGDEGRRKGKYREHSDLLDPPIEALDKATASTKISSEQCTWPDSDRVKCHRLPSAVPSLRAPCSPASALAFPISLKCSPLSSFLPRPFPPPPSPSPRTRFPFSRDREIADAAIRDRRTRRKLPSVHRYRPAMPKTTVLDRLASHDHSSSPSYVAHTDGCTRLSIATESTIAAWARSPLRLSPIVDPFLPLAILAARSFSQLTVDRPPLLPFSYPIAKLIASIFPASNFHVRECQILAYDSLWIIYSKCLIAYT